jgi:lipoprotein-anchoring transpeptidase ErfK/SrfK
VQDKKAVERALQVSSAKPATGAWFWPTATQVIFRTKNGSYWQPNQQVTLKAKLSGVRAGKGSYGVNDTTRRFTIGDSHIVTASTKTKRAVARRNGVKVKSWPISAGKGGRVVNGVDTFLTTSGIHLTMGKENPAIMTSEWMGVDPKDKKNGGYKEVIPWAVRISNSGEYLHQTSGQEWCLGEQNCSHGCVRQPADDAQWFYKTVQPGDIVDIKGTKRKVEYDNGWSFWQLSWDRWRKGSALQ